MTYEKQKVVWSEVKHGYIMLSENVLEPDRQVKLDSWQPGFC